MVCQLHPPPAITSAASILAPVSAMARADAGQLILSLHSSSFGTSLRLQLYATLLSHPGSAPAMARADAGQLILSLHSSSFRTSFPSCTASALLPPTRYLPLQRQEPTPASLSYRCTPSFQNLLMRFSFDLHANQPLMFQSEAYVFPVSCHYAQATMPRPLCPGHLLFFAASHCRVGW